VRKVSVWKESSRACGCNKGGNKVCFKNLLQFLSGGMEGHLRRNRTAYISRNF
jgi:hypothetical protein